MLLPKPTEESNPKIEDLEERSAKWQKGIARDIEDSEAELAKYQDVEIEDEVIVLTEIDNVSDEISRLASQIRELKTEKRSLSRQVDSSKKEITRLESEVHRLSDELTQIDDSKCPTCGQEWHISDDDRDQLVQQAEQCATDHQQCQQEIDGTNEELSTIDTQLQTVVDQESQLQDSLGELRSVPLVLGSVEEAASITARLEAVMTRLDEKRAEANPHLESIESLKENAIQEVDDTNVKELQRLIEHYNLLIKLLTDKDSFIRKKIIGMGLPFLNKRVKYHLSLLELPHRVIFQEDMSVEIWHYEEEYEYGNLSKGERQRVNIAINFSFQDVFEYLNYRINLLMIDEMLDNGICARGAENAVTDLRDMSNTKGKRVFLVSHRDDIAARIEDVMTVQKESDISRINYG